jgi:DNA-binding CsgD family transcriptional regulator
MRESVPLFHAIPEERMEPPLLLAAGLAGLFLREAQEGRDLLERALQVARERAPTGALPVLLFFLGRHGATASEDWRLARALYEESARVAAETTQSIWEANALAGLAWLDAYEGREADCAAHARTALDLADRHDLGFVKAWALTALGQLDLGLGRAAAALGHLQQCESTLLASGISDPDLSPAPDIVDALVRLGRNQEARTVLVAYMPTAEAKGQPFALARSARAQALLAPDPEMTAAFESALDHHARGSDVFERARTQLFFGERLRRARRRVEARRQLRRALQTFDRLGAVPWADRALAELKASGETARVRDDSQRNTLTPQELQVALALAEGRTTREAAAKLYVSPKTIEYHLRNVYDKLEIRSREQLAGALGVSQD